MKASLFVQVKTLKKAKEIILLDDGSWEKYLLVVTKSGNRYTYPYTKYNKQMLTKSGRGLTGIYETGLEA